MVRSCDTAMTFSDCFRGQILVQHTFVAINALQQNTQLMVNCKTYKPVKINTFKQFHFECQFSQQSANTSDGISLHKINGF